MGNLDRTIYEDNTIDLAEYLNNKTAKRSAKFVNQISRAAGKNGKDIGNINDAIKSAKEQYKGVFRDMEKTVRRKLASTMLQGADEMTAAGSVRRNKDKEAVLDGLTKNVQFYSEAYFRRIAEPNIKRFIKANKGSPTFKRDFEAMLKRTLTEAETYWGSVADTVTGRSYNYGLLKGAEKRGYSKYMLIAVIDSRTTPFCRSIDGKTFPIRKAMQDIEDLAALRGKDVQHGPWALVSEGKASKTEMMEKGFTSPPFHSSCRTRVQIV